MLMESYIGTVMTNDKDPDKQFGVECVVDGLGLADDIYPVHFRPIFPPNRIGVPDIGQQIEVLIPGDENTMPGEGDIGTIDYAEFVFYTGRIFDQVNGKVPQELLQNYPKRAGIMWNVDGTIVYYDSTKKQKEFLIKLTDGSTFVSLKEDEVNITLDQLNIRLKDSKITLTGEVELGGSGAAEKLMKGTTVHGDLTTFFGSMNTAAVALAGTTDPSGAVAGAYGTAIVAALAILQPALSNWLSAKHNLDL